MQPLIVEAKIPLSLTQPERETSLHQTIEELKEKNLPCLLALAPKRQARPVFLPSSVSSLKWRASRTQIYRQVETIQLFVLDLIFSKARFRNVGTIALHLPIPKPLASLIDACDPGKPNHGENFYVAALASSEKLSDYEKENIKAMLSAAIFLFFQNNEKAIELFRNPLLKNEGQALNHLGLAYIEGKGVKKDLLKAANYFKKAAKLNNAAGLNNLGSFYLNHFRDYKRAFKCYSQSAELGFPLG